MTIGIPELLVVLAAAVPILGAVYAIATLVRSLRTVQRDLSRAVPQQPAASDDDAETKSVRRLSNGAIRTGLVLAARYEIRRLIGSGGMGAVYEARDLELDGPVALKVILPDITADPARAAVFTQRLRQELQLARRVTHRNVLRIHDMGEAHGLRFITMPYIEGPDLGAILAASALPVERAIRLGRQMIEGVAAAHDAGVVHRDLKPQNILVDRNDTVYVSDFGLAKWTDRGSDLTMTGEVLCTPRYAAPEQLEGKPADPRSDVYALGLILYQMLTRAFPFSGDSPRELLAARLTSVPGEPNRLNPEIPTAVSSVVMRCLERDAGVRYQSARQLLVDFDAQTAGSQSVHGED
jgi:serine/threonine-protein kinase